MSTVLPVHELGALGAARGPAEESRGVRSPRFEAELERTRADSGTLVRTERTSIGGKAAAEALRAAWAQVTGEEPSDDTLAVLTAHWAHETGNGRSMMNFNFAGLKGKGPGGLTVACSTREGFGADATRLVDNFRAYRSAEEGAKDYVSLLERRYPKAVEAARAGDPEAFVGALKERGYFTDDVGSYRARVTQLARQARALGFDAIGTAEAAAAFPLERTFPETGGFRGLPNVPFHPDTMTHIGAGSSSPSGGPGVDPSALYEEIARASLRLGEAMDAREDDEPPPNRII